MQILENRVAIISGGTGALGRAVADNLLIGAQGRGTIGRRGGSSNPQKATRQSFSDANIFLKRADVGDEGQTAKFVAEVASKCGKLDILVNLVGGFWGGKPIAETTIAEWQAMFDLNVRPTFLCCPAAVPG